MPLSAAALEPLLRLAQVPGFGPNRLAMLLRRFGSAERALAAPPGDLARMPGMGAELARRLRTAAAPEAGERARAALAAMERVGAVALTPDDLEYPADFRTLNDPPYLLFAAGDLSLMHAPAMAIVGTRQPTDYGRRAASGLSAALVEAGYAVASGMARGIDTAAHVAALTAGGGTVGVLGNGIDQVYPPENRDLFRQVRERGLLLTELPPGERPRAGNFPRRNRLIAALSLGVLVVEMGERSGALHTVNFAVEQGKEVFAVPGPIGSPVSSGTNQLIKDGARVVTSVEDVLEELQGVGRASAPAGTTARTERAPHAAPPAPAAPDVDLSGLGEEERRVLAALDGEPRHVDMLAESCGMPTSAVLSALLTLELSGLVESLPGKHFRRA